MKAKVELALGGALNWVLRIGGGHVIEANWTGLIGTVGFVRNTHGSARARGDIVVCIQGSPRFHSMLPDICDVLTTLKLRRDLSEHWTVRHKILLP